MASHTVTLAQASKLTQNDLIAGVIEDVVTTNPVYNLLPFQPVNGNAKAYNRENALGEAQFLGIGEQITAKDAATFTKVTTALTTIIGDASVNGLIQASGIGSDGSEMGHAAVQISSKAKNVGRKFQNAMFNGDNSGSPGDDEFDGFAALLSAGQTVDYTDGTQDWFVLLDELLQKVKSKDGQVDVISMSERDIRRHRRELRELGGATMDKVEIDGVIYSAYAGVPVITSGYIVPATGGSPEALRDTIYAWNVDDGSEKTGVAGLTSVNNAGIHVEDVGPAEDYDELIWRVKWYCALAVYSDLALAGATNVLDE